MPRSASALMAEVFGDKRDNCYADGCSGDKAQGDPLHNRQIIQQNLACASKYRFAIGERAHTT